MSITLKKIFNKNKNIVIGSLHFPALLGFDDFPGYKKTIQMALADLEAYQEGGVDGLFLENNYGLSGEKIEKSHAIAMSYIIGEIRSRTTLPLGVNVLWNDYETAFSLAHTHNLQFIRIPVFVDTVEAYCGVITGDPEDVQKTRKNLQADDVAIFTDILVKHSKHISKHSLEAAAKKAISHGSNALIVTGDWTGQSPALETVAKLRSQITSFPILIGSGVDYKNISSLSEYANGVIVSTSLKKGSSIKGEQNVKGFKQRISRQKVNTLVRSLS